MKVVTDGTFIKVETTPGQFKDVPRRFNVLAEHGEWLWVKAMNGQFTGESPLTFLKRDLKECK